MTSPQAIHSFWFEEIDKALWWKKDDAFDALLAERFGEVHASAVSGELWQWREGVGNEAAQGRLAEILVLDQFSRNLFRNDARAFAQDAQALTLAQEMVLLGLDREIEPSKRMFAYMPYMHSESKKVHNEAVKLFERLAKEYEPAEKNLEFEHKHKDIIDRFNRYPHRNELLCRHSTQDELEFLKENKGF